MMMWAYKSKNVTTKQACKNILDEKAAPLDMMHNLLGKQNLQVEQLFVYHDHP